MAMHTYNCSTRGVQQEDQGFQASLDYILPGFVFKNNKKMLGMVLHIFNLSTWEAKESRYLSLRPAWSIP